MFMCEHICEDLLSASHMWLIKNTLRAFLFSCVYNQVCLSRERNGEKNKEKHLTVADSEGEQE